MTDQFTTERHGHRIEIESDESLVVVSRVRLFVDGKLSDERSTLWDVRLHGELHDGEKEIPVKVDVSYGFFGGVEKCVLIEDGTEYPMREEKRKPRDARQEAASPELAPPEADKEGELLRAMKENGCRISATTAAMETSLSTTEADKILSELASDGHLFVESGGGAMIYALPENEPPDSDR